MTDQVIEKIAFQFRQAFLLARKGKTGQSIDLTQWSDNEAAHVLILIKEAGYVKADVTGKVVYLSNDQSLPGILTSIVDRNIQSNRPSKQKVCRADKFCSDVKIGVVQKPVNRI